jgi:hypothetical protein
MDQRGSRHAHDSSGLGHIALGLEKFATTKSESENGFFLIELSKSGTQQLLGPNMLRPD